MLHIGHAVARYGLTSPMTESNIHRGWENRMTHCGLWNYLNDDLEITCI